MYRKRSSVSVTVEISFVGYKLHSVLNATEFICCMSSGKRASRFLKDKFTVLRFCFPHASLKCFFFFHSLAVFVMDVVSSMGNYISILYHNSVISTKNSKNWVTFCASLQSLNCNFNMQYANERPKQFPINGRREDCIPLMRIN